MRKCPACWRYSPGSGTRAGGAAAASGWCSCGTTYYGYDSVDRASTITDPDGNTTYVTYDAHDNLTSTTTCAVISNCQTTYTSYYEDLANPLDHCP